jgi:hypothetical protein
VKARQFTPVAPLHTAPLGPSVSRTDVEDAMADALRGVVLGGYDEIVCSRLVRQLDLTSLRTLVSMIERVREAGNLEAVDAEITLHRPQPRHRQVDRGTAQVPPNYGPGGGWISGAGRAGV